VAVGQCLFCHNPHKSKIEHLLTAPEPGLCYQCHDVDTIELIAAHLPKQLSACTDCHNAHASSTKGLLKGSSSETNDGFGYANMAEAKLQNNIEAAKDANEQIYSKQAATASETLLKSRSLSEVFREASRLIKLGELQQAGAYLGKFKDSNSFTAEERSQIARVLGMIDSVITGNERPLENDNKSDKQGTSENKRKSETTVFEERVRFKTEGDIYHPDLLFYNAILGLGLAQQSIDSDEESDRHAESLNDYNIFAHF